MANNARVTIIGTVISEPQNRQTSNNQTIFSMKVGVKTTKRDEKTPYPLSDVYDVSVWGKPGEALIGKIHSKTKVWVCGDMCMGEPWNDRQGNTHISPRVNASIVEIIGEAGSKSNNNNYNNNNNNNNNYNNNNNNNNNNEQVAEDPNNLPF